MSKVIKTFNDLEFNPVHDGVGARINFSNGYGASVVKHSYSYGHQEGLYELAVLYKDSLCYTSGITEDVIGWLSKEDVTEYLRKIQQLN